jgi:hypothetical protein
MRDILFVVAVIALIVFWPLGAIWAVNTLFGFAIAYTFENWLAVVVLVALFGKANVNVKI